MDRDTKKFIGLLLVVFYVGSAVGTPLLGAVLALIVILIWENGRLVRNPKYHLELQMDLPDRVRKNQEAVLTLTAHYTARFARVRLKTEVHVQNLLTGENMVMPVEFHVQGPGNAKYRLKISDQRCGKIEARISSCELGGLKFQASRTLPRELRAAVNVEPDLSAAEVPASVAGMAGKNVLVLLDNTSNGQVSILPDRKSRVTEQFCAAAAALRRQGASVSLSWFDPAMRAFLLREIRKEEDWDQAVDQILETGFAETDSASIFSLTAQASQRGYDQFYAAEAAPRADLDDLRRLGPVEVL